MASSSHDRLPVADLKNIGETTASWLNSVGVLTFGDLNERGAVATFLMLRENGFRPTMNALYAFHGALTDTHWAQLSDNDKKNLKSELDRIDSQSEH